MRKLAANKIFTGIKKRPWITNGIIYTDDNGKILKLSDDFELDKEKSNVEYYSGILAPGLVNAHLHLEMSWMFNQFDNFYGIEDFISKITKFKGKLDDDEKKKKMTYFDALMQAEGIVLGADVINTDLSLSVKKKSKISHTNFVEIYGLDENLKDVILNSSKKIYNQFKKEGLETYFSVHSTYSLSEKLFFSVSELLKNEKISTIHFLEGKSEVSLFSNKRNEKLINVLLEKSEKLPFNLWKNKPEDYIYRLFPTDANLLLVHNTFTNKEIIRNIKKIFKNAYFVICPSSNITVERTLPKQETFKGFEEYLLVGTDSVVTNRTNMSLSRELNILLQNGWEFETILFAVTLNGAKALKKENIYGSLEIGKKPGITLIKFNGKEIIDSKKIF